MEMPTRPPQPPSPPRKRKPGRCPLCEKAGVEHYRPFCSKRCADLDLGRWLKGSYRIESDEDLADRRDDDPRGQP